MFATHAESSSTVTVFCTTQIDGYYMIDPPEDFRKMPETGSCSSETFKSPVQMLPHNVRARREPHSKPPPYLAQRLQLGYISRRIRYVP